ncbi:glycosyltransferase family 4 protein [Thermodesulfobacteriota bacterium]
MRVGVNTLFLVPGDVGGTEVYLRENLKEMIPGNPDDTFVLFTSEDNDASLRRDLDKAGNVEFIQLHFRSGIRPLRIIAEQTILPWTLRKQSLDVMWSPGYTAPLLCSCPQVVTIHDLQYKSHPDDLSFLERITLDFLVKNACRRCDAIIAVSEFSKSEIVRFGFAPADKIAVIYEGVDPGFGEPSSGDISRLVKLPPQTPYILCVAHTYPHKQVHVLVQAFGLIMDDIDHHLVLVGRPRRGEPELRRSIDLLNKQDRVHRINDLNYNDLKAVFQHADLFVLPSAYEGFGLPVLEAMLAGIPVVTTERASLPEVGGDHAYFVRKDTPEGLAETIREALGLSRQELEKLILEGKSWARSFSWERSAAQTIKVLHTLMS